MFLIVDFSLSSSCFTKVGRRPFSPSASVGLVPLNVCSVKLTGLRLANDSRWWASTGVDNSSSMKHSVGAVGFGVVGGGALSFDLKSVISVLRASINFSYSATCALAPVTFALTVTLMFLARLAYLRVLTVSSYDATLAETHAILTVRQFPPKESLRSLVNLLLR